MLDVGRKPHSVGKSVCHDLPDHRVVEDCSAPFCGIPGISPLDLQQPSLHIIHVHCCVPRHKAAARAACGSSACEGRSSPCRTLPTRCGRPLPGRHQDDEVPAPAGQRGFLQSLLMASPPMVESLYDRIQNKRSLQAVAHLSFNDLPVFGLHLYNSTNQEVLQNLGHLPSLQTEQLSCTRPHW